MQDSKYAVLLLSHDESSDSDRFKLMDSFPSIDECQGYIWRYDTAVLSSGDIFTICDIAYVSDVYNYAEGTYIVGEDLDIKKAPLIMLGDATWLSAWKNEDVFTLLEVSLVHGVSRDSIYRAIMLCFKSMMAHTMQGDYTVGYIVELLDEKKHISARYEINKQLARQKNTNTTPLAILSNLEQYMSSDSTTRAFSAINVLVHAFVDEDMANAEATAIFKSVIPLRVVLLAAVAKRKTT